MAIVVIGGHTRNIGKTSVVCALLSALPAYNWTAIKITQFGHNVCSANGKPCDCETADHALAISEERNPTTGTDSSRFLAAGAARSLWVRTRQGQLAEAMPRIRAEIARSENILFESNSILRFLQPDFYASVLHPAVADFKPSALRYLDRAHALLLSSAPPSASACEPSAALPWPAVSHQWITRIPTFRIAPPHYASPDFAAFVAKSLETKYL
ncbi:MAG TPA: hypothetical protein VGU23_07645, partial [Acidobacteriaceae bacterium]|nr:hypothetical protein [Acidobacteriaceae bacterium]